MTSAFAFLGDFGGAIEFIFKERESVSGGVQIGGLPELAGFGITHLWISVAAVALALVIAVPIGLILGHKGKGEFVAISTSNIGRAVPSLALLAFFIAFIGVGPGNVILVLVLLAIPPILTNTYVGVRQVDRDTIDAARGMGMSSFEIISKVRFPLALPLIFGGIRTASVNVVATATIAPLANVQTLGEPIVTPQTYGLQGQIGAAIIVAIVTIMVDLGFARLQQILTPKGLKVAQPAAAKSRRGVLSFRKGTPAT
jgi:osmoprotectant transport system permease protein